MSRSVRLKVPILDPFELFLLIINGVGWAGFFVAFYLWGPM